MTHLHRAIPFRLRRATAPLALLGAAVLATVLPARAADLIPFSEIKPGMTGVGRTVWNGSRIEEFQVEVLGTLENVGPRRNLILTRLSGGPLEKTGVLAGMSGSPVYFGGRLAGAVAYTWGFAREPIAGVVPFQEMLEIETRDTPPPARASLPPEAGPVGLAWLTDPGRLAAHFGSYLDRVATRPLEAGAMTPIATPILFGGFPREVVDALTPGLKDAGLLALQGGAAGRSTAPSGAGLEPGAAVAIGLVRGDVEIAAICTVTAREADRLWACGHPLLGLGPTELVMSTATISGLLPSLESSFKFGTARDPAGVFRQDRATGVFGIVGRNARTIPVEVTLKPPAGRPRRIAFEVAADPFLAPYLVYAALNAILTSEEKDYGVMSFTYDEGSLIKVAGESDLNLRNLFAGDVARLYATGMVAFLTELLLNSEYRAVQVEGIHLVLGVSDERRTARLLRAWTNRDHARAGESIQVSIGLKPFRGPEVTREMTVTIPAEVPPGRLLLQIGDATALARTDTDQIDDLVPRDLKQLIWLVNNLRRNDRLYAVLTRSDNGLIFQGERLPNLPPSISQVMARPQTRGNYARVWYRGVAEESIPLGYAVEGYRLLSLDVEE